MLLGAYLGEQGGKPELLEDHPEQAELQKELAGCQQELANTGQLNGLDRCFVASILYLCRPTCICVVHLVFVSSILCLCRPSCCVLLLLVCSTQYSISGQREIFASVIILRTFFFFFFFFLLSGFCLAILLFYYSYTLHQKSFETLLLFIQMSSFQHFVQIKLAIL